MAPFQNDRGERDRIAVIIPYYQNKSGLLYIALQSIFSQKCVENLDFDIIVVDDSSPVPPDDDIAQVDPAWRSKIRMISQKNAGPAAARNTGLDAVQPNTRYIAFLDSDDVWLEHHIMTAISAIQSGADISFSNNWVEDGRSWFSAHPIIGDKYHQYRDAKQIVTLSGDELLEILIEEPIIHLSTLVIESRKLGDERFAAKLLTGEDHLYTLQLADRSSTIGLNMQPTMRRGDGGVNFYRGTLDWNSPKSAWRALSTVAKYYAIGKAMAHRPDIRKNALLKADITIQETVFLIGRNFRRYPKETFQVLRDAWNLWGFKCAYAFVVSVKLIFRRLKGQVDFRV